LKWIIPELPELRVLALAKWHVGSGNEIAVREKVSVRDKVIKRLEDRTKLKNQKDVIIFLFLKRADQISGT